MNDNARKNNQLPVRKKKGKGQDFSPGRNSGERRIAGSSIRWTNASRLRFDMTSKFRLAITRELLYKILNYHKEQIKMAIHIIPVDKLSAEALHGIIQEFISRNGTDYGEFEASVEKKFRQVKQKLENGLAVLLYDDEMETTNIFRHDDPILKKLDKLNEEN